MDNLLRVFKAAADPTRLRILRMLSTKPLCVCEVMSVLGMAQSTTSKHLRILEDAGFVMAIPGGTWTIYRLAPQTNAARRLIEITSEAKPLEQCKDDLRLVKAVDRDRLKHCYIKKPGAKSLKKAYSQKE